MTSPAQVPGSGRTFVAVFGLLTSWTGQSRGRLLLLLLFLALPAFLTGCGGKAVDAGPQPYERVSPIEDEDRLYRDDAATLPDTMRWIIRDESSLSEVWTQATQSMDDPPPSLQSTLLATWSSSWGLGDATPGIRSRWRATAGRGCMTPATLLGPSRGLSPPSAPRWKRTLSPGNPSPSRSSEFPSPTCLSSSARKGKCAVGVDIE